MNFNLNKPLKIKTLKLNKENKHWTNSLYYILNNPNPIVLRNLFSIHTPWRQITLKCILPKFKIRFLILFLIMIKMIKMLRLLLLSIFLNGLLKKKNNFLSIKLDYIMLRFCIKEKNFEIREKRLIKSLKVPKKLMIKDF